jgi:hypothetical protein
MSDPISGSPYIIICATRTAVAAENDPIKKIVAVSKGACDLAWFMQSYYKHFQPVDLHPISVIQHQLMDHITGVHPLTPEEITTKIDGLFAEMDSLEDKY